MIWYVIVIFDKLCISSNQKLFLIESITSEVIKFHFVCRLSGSIAGGIASFPSKWLSYEAIKSFSVRHNKDLTIACS